MSAFVLGSSFPASVQQHLLSAYVHRFTREHRPVWASRPDCKTCPVQFASDAEWLANTRFAVNRDGSLSKRNRYCESRPTWPDNPELRK